MACRSTDLNKWPGPVQEWTFSTCELQQTRTLSAVACHRYGAVSESLTEKLATHADSWISHPVRSPSVPVCPVRASQIPRCRQPPHFQSSSPAIAFGANLPLLQDSCLLTAGEPPMHAVSSEQDLRNLIGTKSFDALPAHFWRARSLAPGGRCILRAAEPALVFGHHA